jgi:hypothetical protein
MKLVLLLLVSAAIVVAATLAIGYRGANEDPHAFTETTANRCVSPIP